MRQEKIKEDRELTVEEVSALETLAFKSSVEKERQVCHEIVLLQLLILAAK